MGEDLELRRRAEDDERSTLARIESLQSHLASEQRHLVEVRLFQSMLNGYVADEPATLRPPRETEVASAAAPVDPAAGDAETEAGLSAAQAEELERLNRLFGLNAGSN